VQAPNRDDASGPLRPDAIQIQALAGEIPAAINGEEASRLEAYGGLLQRWNQVHNLTAIRNPAELLTHHLIDSLAALPAIEQAVEQAGLDAGALRFLDAGSGGGLPGIPLAIVRPHWNFTLVDAVQKKVAFLQQAIATLPVPNATARHERLESPTQAPVDVAISRAFSSLEDFVRLTGHRLRPGGIWLAMKGKRPDAELGCLPPTVGRVNVVTLHVPRLSEERHLVVMHQRPPA
jgi:16S rRNA (guanine527-N7)-methyltransferase